MTREVLITVTGIQKLAEDQEDTVEVITKGEYFFRNGKHFLLYTETDEESGLSTSNTVKFSRGFMESTKKGGANVHMRFEPGKETQSYYNTSFGEILMGISTVQVEVEEEEDYIMAEAEYALAMNYDHVADCRIRLEIRPRKTAVLML